MKKPLLLLFVLLLFVSTQDMYALYFQDTEQAPGKKMSFQGTLYENGEPVNGNRTFTFAIALDNEETWTETQADVLVVEGLYAVTLGSINPLPEDLFYNAQERVLTVTIGSTTLGSTTLYAPFSVNSKGDFMLNSVNPEDSMAVNAEIYGTGATPYNMAVRGLARTDLSNTGVGGIAEGSDTNSAYQSGVIGNAYSNNPDAWATGTWGRGHSFAGAVAYGMRGEVFGTGGTFSAGARGLNHIEPDENGIRYGGYFNTYGVEEYAYQGRSVGVRGSAIGSYENIGVYGSANGFGEGVTNWSGWFEAAPVTLRAQPLQIHGPEGNLKVDLNYFEPNNSGSMVIYGHNNTRRTIIGAASEGTVGFLGLYDSLDVNRVNIRAYNGNGYIGLSGENKMNIEMGGKYWEEGGLDKGYFKILGNGYMPEGSEEEQVHDLIFMDASFNEPMGLEYGRMETKNQMGQQMSMLDMNDQGAGRFQLMSPDGFTNTLVGSNGPKAGLVHLNDSLGRPTYKMLTYAGGSAYEEMSAGLPEIGETRVVWQKAGYQSPWTNMIGRNDDGSSKGRLQTGWLSGSDNPAFRITSGDSRWLVNLEGGTENGGSLTLEGPSSSNYWFGQKDWEDSNLPFMALRGAYAEDDGNGNFYNPDMLSLEVARWEDGTELGQINFSRSTENGIETLSLGYNEVQKIVSPEELFVNGPSGNQVAAMRRRGGGDFGMAAFTNGNGEMRAEIGSFGDNSGFMQLFGPNNGKNIQMGGTDGNRDLGMLRISGTTENNLVNMEIAVDGANNEFGVLSVGNSLGGGFEIGTRSWENNGAGGDKTYTAIRSTIDVDDGNGGTYRPWLVSQEFHDDGNGNQYGSIGINSTNNTGFVNLNPGNSGNIDISGSVNQSSDARLKKNVVKLTSGLAMVTQLRGVRYNWKDESRPGDKVGFIAQEVEKVLPELVQTRENGFKGVNYAEMTAVLVEAVKELNQQIADLKKENGQLKAELSKVEDMESRLAQIEALLQGTSKTVNTDQK